LKATAYWPGLCGAVFLCAVVALSLTSATAQSDPNTDGQGASQSQTASPHELKVTEYSLPPDKLAKAKALYET
jgi:hypothetical protein